MKKLSLYTIALILAGLAFSSCQQILTDARSDEIKKEMRDFTDEVVGHMNEGDTAAFFSYYSNQFTLLSKGDREVVDRQTREEWKAAVGQRLTGDDRTIYTIEDLWVEVYAHNSANVCHTWVKTTTYENDSTSQSRGAATWTIYREDTGWKIKHAHTSAPG
ncbi:MAG: nuclear transport factor 2 family protein [Bacteroidales bacterium]